MDIQNNFAERRKEKRFKLKSPAYAIINYSPTSIGQITDISRSGLAIRYAKKREGAKEIKQLDIFKPDFSFYIEKIKARTISDLEIVDHTIIGSQEMRRCGIQFEELAETQIGQLDSFIRGNSIST